MTLQSLLLKRRTEAMSANQPQSLYVYYDWVQADSNTGTPVINTGITVNAPKNTTQHRYTFEGAFAKCEAIPSSWNAYFIFTNTNTNYDGSFTLAKQGNKTNLISYMYNNRYGMKGANCTETISNGVWHTFTLTHKDDDTMGGKLVLDGTAYEYTSDSNNPTSSSLFLLGYGTAKAFPCRLARFKIYEYGVLVADLKPAMRISDNVVGFHDVVRDVFCGPSVEGVTLLCGNGLEDFNT